MIEVIPLSAISAFKCSRIPQLFFSISVPDGLSYVLSRTHPRLLVITGGASWRLLSLQSDIQSALEQKTECIEYERISGEPTPDTVQDIVERHRDSIDAVAAIGGGSVIDTGKAVSAMLCENERVERFLEGVGDLTPSGRKLPFFACPTTAGTGSEATKNAVLSKPGLNGYKKSLRHENYIPDAAIIDPALCVSCSLEITLASGLDALSQLLEAYTSSNANPVSDCYALDGISLAYSGFSGVVDNPGDITYRSRLSLAAFYSGIALANAGLGAVHGIAGALGGTASIPHGLICAKLISPVFSESLKLKTNDNFSARISAVEHATGTDFSVLLDEIEGYASLLPSLDSFGLTDREIDAALSGFSNKNALIPIDTNQMAQILHGTIHT